MGSRKGFALWMTLMGLLETYRDKIFETQPWLTRNCRDISHGRTPL